jgi:hypothetical protein
VGVSPLSGYSFHQSSVHRLAVQAKETGAINNHRLYRRYVELDVAVFVSRMPINVRCFF